MVVQTRDLLEAGDLESTKDGDTKDGLDKLHDGPSGKDDSKTNQSIGDLVSGLFDLLLISLGHDPLEPAPDEHEEED